MLPKLCGMLWKRLKLMLNSLCRVLIISQQCNKTVKSQNKNRKKSCLHQKQTNKHTYINEYILLLGFTDCLSAILSGLHAKSKLLQTVVAFNYPTDFFSNLLQLSYYFSNTFTNSSQLQRVYYTTKSSQFSFFKLNNKDTVSLTITY